MAHVNTLTLASGAAGTAGALAAVACTETPFLPGRKARLIVDLVGSAGTDPSITVEGSNDEGTTYTDVATITANGEVALEVVCSDLMRLNVETAAGTTAGTVSAYLEGIY